MSSGTFFDIKRFALHDGDGLRTTAFLKGCPLSCPWCQNPEGIDTPIRIQWTPSRCIHCGLCVESCPRHALAQAPLDDSIAINHERCDLCGVCLDACPTGALLQMGRRVSAGDLVADLLRDRDFFADGSGGVTLSGGEPLAQPAFTAEVLKLLCNEGIHTAVETTLAVPRESVDSVVPWTRQFIVDLKLVDPEEHLAVVGAELSRIRLNLERLLVEGANVLLRIPLIPGFTATEENLFGLGRYIGSLDPEPPVELVNFNPLAAEKYRVLGKRWPIADKTSPYTHGEMESFRGLLEDAVHTTSGRNHE